jgi:hypothetical protein
MAKWVTVDAFELQTGIRREEAQRKCRANEWPEGVAWVYYSEKIRLINLEWWDTKWQEMARASAKRLKTQSKSSLPINLSDAASASNVRQLLQTLER